MSAAESRRVAVVTGAASGIGKAIAARFIWDGYWVGLLDRDEAAAAAALQDLGGADHGTVLPADVSDEAAMAAAFQRVRDQWGRLDVLVNNAALPQRPTPIDSLTSAEWDRLMAVNVKGVFLGIKFAVPLMRDRGGSIINIASVAALRPRPGLNAYCASKAAVIGLTQAVALELAGTGIRVNGIAPGPADTPMLPGFMADPGSAAGRQAFIDSVPLGRLIRPEEIAAAAAYLASDEAAAVIGAILNVDGGRHV
ncbi:MAG: SDR family oxidoreductase [Limnochordales bacterium]|nr:SDR family oxidoreductase [Limnochordales bacterium]